ncbi:MAG TPA: hypothetical protein VHW66_18015 [Stellaceae bacterium]|jgi:hypothetical protein|nr:hypothetical protein [Stellaceae bacterium]
MRIEAIIAGIVMAAAVAAPVWAQPAPAGDPQAQQNVRESQQYDQLACKNAKFRATRIAKECGPLQGSSFYDNCVASFDCGKGQAPVNPKATPPSEKIQ